MFRKYKKKIQELEQVNDQLYQQFEKYKRMGYILHGYVYPNCRIKLLNLDRQVPVNIQNIEKIKKKSK